MFDEETISSMLLDVIDTDVGFVRFVDVFYDPRVGTTVTVKVNMHMEYIRIWIADNIARSGIEITESLYQTIYDITRHILKECQRTFTIIVSDKETNKYTELIRFEKRWLSYWTAEKWKEYVEMYAKDGEELKTDEIYMSCVVPVIEKTGLLMKFGIDFAKSLHRYYKKKYAEILSKVGKDVLYDSKKREKLQKYLPVFTRHRDLCVVLERNENFKYRKYGLSIGFAIL